MPGQGRAEASWEGLSKPPALGSFSTASWGPVSGAFTSVVEHPISINKKDLEEPQGKLQSVALPVGPGHPGAVGWGRHSESSILESPSSVPTENFPSPRSSQELSLPWWPVSPPGGSRGPPSEVPAWGIRQGSFSRSRCTASTRKGTSRKARKPDT